MKTAISFLLMFGIMATVGICSDGTYTMFVTNDLEYYEEGDTVYIWGPVEKDGVPTPNMTVEITVTGPQNFSDMVVTDWDGYFRSSFDLWEEGSEGEYSLYVYAPCPDISDTTEFGVNPSENSETVNE